MLLDAGLSGRAVKRRLEENGLSISNIKMILVTHDHVDHIKCLGSISERLRVPVYASPLVAMVLNRNKYIAPHVNGCIRVIRPEECAENLGVKFTCFEVPHDATQTVGYYVDFFGDKFLFATDLGETNDEVLRFGSMADHLMIESNYDSEMLIDGNYPPVLKNRIMNRLGHLSNEQTASFLKAVYHKGIRHVWLCHLSENNNTPSKALESAFEALSSVGARPGEDMELNCLPRCEASAVYVME